MPRMRVRNGEQGSLCCAVAVESGVPDAELGKRLTERVREQLDGHSADLCMLLASAHLEEAIEGIALSVAEHLLPRCMFGATGEAIISGETEYEGQPAVTLWAAHLPGCRVNSFHLSQSDLRGLDSPAALRDHLSVSTAENPFFLLLGDPFSVDVLDVLHRFEQAYPGRPCAGGMASGAQRPRQSAIIFDGQTLRHGLCGVALRGGMKLDCIVSQGCRPIGQEMVVSEARRNVIYALDGDSPLKVLREMLDRCSPQDRELACQRGLLIGCSICEGPPGEYLIRNPMRFDSESGALEINDFVHEGQRVRFHVRDAESAHQELDTILQRAAPSDAAGALLFSCNGRGTRLFPHKSHDARTIASRCGGLPLAGLFCAGEIGPIRNRNFLHGHTASIGFIRPEDE